MAALEEYTAKRNFTKSSEPKARRGRKAGSSFVIQKHAARRLHYDLRLELDGVLKSWAVTRGPSLVPGDKRLAVEVEDHPIEYGSFEGNIPKGEYGAGSVIVWDRGTWKPTFDPHLGLRKGHLSFELSGEKLHGSWHLVRMHRRRGEKRDNWLLIKQDDDGARLDGAPDILEEAPNSVISARSNEDVAAGVEKADGRAAAKQPVKKKKVAARPAKSAGPIDEPSFVPPCLATLQPRPPAGDRWLHEIKFDGYRIQARLHDGVVTLFTRSGLDWTKTFGSAIAEAVAALDAQSLLIDGEVVVESEAGASDYVALREDLSSGRTDRFRFYAFDLLSLDGVDLRRKKLEQRKQQLRTLLSGLDQDTQPLRFSEAFPEQGDLVLQHACRLSLEGIVSKLRDAPYRSGRSGDWVKSKCSDRQEFVIVGWTPSTATPRAIGSLILAYHEDGRLVHAGRVGTGFGRGMAQELWERLSNLDTAKMPFEDSPERSSRDVRWVSPELVAEIEYRGWTGEQLLRHASFRGLRDDKPASEIVREDAQARESAPVDSPAKKKAPRTSQKPKVPAIRLTHPDRIYWPDAGVTKQGLVDYYADVWPSIAPHVVARPLSLMRCPDGVEGKCFFQKSAWRGMNSAITVLENPGDGGDTVLAIDSLEGLVALVQGGVLEIHPWGVRIDDLDHPDQLTFDLDPGEGVAWEQLRQAAFDVRDRLAAMQLTSYVKTTGGKGLHVVVPVKPKADWEQAKAFAHDLASSMSGDAPDLYTATMTKKLRSGRIFVDWLRNGRGSTAVSAYSSRARAGAPVSTPLGWDELDLDVRGPHFNVENVPSRLGNIGSDPWAGFFKTRQVIPTSKPTKGRRRT